LNIGRGAAELDTDARLGVAVDEADIRDMPSQAIQDMCGRWRPRDSSVLIELLLSGETLLVTATDTDDGERLRIADLEWDDETIWFTMITPSTGWTVQHSLRIKESGAIECVAAVVDQWEKA
jgi:hypothetical protein